MSFAGDCCQSQPKVFHSLSVVFHALPVVNRKEGTVINRSTYRSMDKADIVERLGLTA